MGLFDFLFSSKFSKVQSELKKTVIGGTNLEPQSILLSQARDEGYPLFQEGQKDLELKMLVNQKVNIMAAATSLERFKKARDICVKNGMKEAGVFFQEYVKLYEYYIKNYDKVGGPKTW